MEKYANSIVEDKKYISNSIRKRACIMKKSKLGLVFLTLATAVVLMGSAAKAKTASNGFVKQNGKVGKYRVTVDLNRKENTLYVTKAQKKIKIDSGDIGVRTVVAQNKLFYTKGVELYRCSMTGKNKKVIDTECKSNNDPAIKIIAYSKGCMYYSKPVDKSFKKLYVYRYQISSGKKEICQKRDFSYEYCIDIYRDYKYGYDEPTDIAGSYRLYVSKLSSNKQRIFAKNVYSHKFIKNNVYYMTADKDKGIVKFIKAGLDGKNKKVIASFDYKKDMKEKNHVDNGVIVAFQKLSADKAEFLVFYLDKKGIEQKVLYSINFKTGVTTRK